MDIWKTLVDYWRRSGVTIRPGADAAAVRAFESKYQLALPADLRSYFEAVNGMSDQMDPDLFRFWPLDEVKPVHEELSGSAPDAYPGCFLFADHCIWCWAYAVRLGESSVLSGPVFRVTAAEEPGEKMADSFLEFMEKYVAKPLSII